MPETFPIGQVSVLAQKENYLLVPDYWTGLFLGPERYCNAEEILRRISLARSKFRTNFFNKTKAIKKLLFKMYGSVEQYKHTTG